jgi:hypothetical protein
MSRTDEQAIAQADPHPAVTYWIERVLQRAGFTIVGTDVSYANARNADIEETILRLD